MLLNYMEELFFFFGQRFIFRSWRNGQQRGCLALLIACSKIEYLGRSLPSWEIQLLSHWQEDPGDQQEKAVNLSHPPLCSVTRLLFLPANLKRLQGRGVRLKTSSMILLCWLHLQTLFQARNTGRLSCLGTCYLLFACAVNLLQFCIISDLRIFKSLTGIH